MYRDKFDNTFITSNIFIYKYLCTYTSIINIGKHRYYMYYIRNTII